MEPWVRGVLGAVLMPLPLITLGLVVALLGFRRAPRFSRGLLAASLALLWLSAWDPVVSALLPPLETRHARLNQPVAGVRHVVVMGAGHFDHPILPLSNRPNDAAIYRLIEGIVQYRRHPGSRLVLSGGNGQPEPHADILAAVARELGVPGEDMVLQRGSRDTAEEAAKLVAMLGSEGLLVAMLGSEGLLVVTSAAHMERTLFWFRHAGADPVAAPTHFLGRVQGSLRPWPHLDNLVRTSFAWHEYLGLVWAHWTTGRAALSSGGQ